MKGNSRNSATVWLVIGVIVLIVLLAIWMEAAFLFGDTDVAAFNNLTPVIETFKYLS